MELKMKVLEANKKLAELGLVMLTWGNVSVVDRTIGVMYIKPSGVEYEKLGPEDIVSVDIKTGTYKGKLKPSSDTDTHLEMYHNFKNINSIVHTHSTWATIWAQMGKNIPALGTTHADYFSCEIPCSRKLTEREIMHNYELNTGKVICETIKKFSLKENNGAVLVCEHGPFCWGETPEKAVENALVLEEISKMAYFTCMKDSLNKTKMSQYLLDKHYYRKHGKNAYYGQNSKG